MLKFREDNLHIALVALVPSARTIFAASCAQRLFAAYCDYCYCKGLPICRLDSHLKYVWEHALETGRERHIDQRVVDAMTLIPSEQESEWSPQAGYAEDAVVAVAYSLRCVASGKVEEAVWSARRAYEAVDLFATSSSGMAPSEVGFELSVLANPIVQAELRRQADDLSRLRGSREHLSAALNELRKRSESERAIPAPGTAR